MKYTRIAEDTFQNLQLNAGILVRNFVPETGTFSEILGATTGGVSFATNPEYSDFGEDIDNVPANMKELKKLSSMSPVMSGTFVSVSPELAKALIGASDVDEEDLTHIVPRVDLLESDFEDVWWIGDYSDANTGDDAGFLAIHLMNSLSTTGFNIQSNDDGKGNLEFEFTGHYSMDNQDQVPFELYIKKGTTNSIKLDKTSETVAISGTVTLTATTVPADAVVVWSSSDDNVASVSSGVVTGVSVGTAIITAKIVVDSKEYKATCSITVTE